MVDPDDRRARGIAAYASQFGIDESAVESHMAGMLGERMAREAIMSAGGGTWEDDVLSLRDRSLVVVASLIAQGGVEARLRGHVRWALAHDITPEQLEALVTLLAVYVGYPRASVGMEIVREEIAAVHGQ
jgi:4-carboxymuconolactone decarboxylase